MNKDVDPRQIKPDQYSDGYNVSISQDGRDGQLSSFLGVTSYASLLSSINADHSKFKLLAFHEAEYTIDSSATPTLMGLAFAYNTADKSFYIWAIEQDGTKYTQYSKTLTTEEDALLKKSNYNTSCVIYGEGGKNYAYAATAGLPMIKLPLEIDTTGKGGTTPYVLEEIILTRTGFRGGVELNTISSTGGDLLSGSYQFALRLIDNDLNKYTKFSLLTNPIFIGIEESTTSKSYGGVGFVSTEVINLTLTTEEDYTDRYTHYQLAVVENLNGDTNGSSTVKLLQPEVMTTFTSTQAYAYATNKPAKELIDISELTVDDAAIRTVETLTVKNNRLLLGNTEYHPLDYDNGDPIVGNTTATLREIFTDEGATAYSNPENASKNVGYFRDELYRFGVVYEDKYGNFSKPKVLDFSACTQNSTDAGIDWKFPARNDGYYGTLLNASDDIIALGLNMIGLDNHPTWAVAAHIVRVPRKKKIQFQSPLVPSIFVHPAKVDGSYPDQRYSTDEANIDVLNVEAANPDGTFIPKNFFHVLPKNMVRFGDLYGASDINGGLYVTHANSTITSYYGVIGATASTWVYEGDSQRVIYEVQVSAGGIEIWKDYYYYEDPMGVYDPIEEFTGFTNSDVGVFTLKRRDKTSSGTFGTTVGSIDLSTLVSEQSIDISSGGDINAALNLQLYDYLIEFTNS